jgi:hypothetical protein
MLFGHHEIDQDYRSPISVFRDPLFQQALLVVIIVDMAFVVWAVAYSGFFSYSSVRTIRAIYKQRSYFAESGRDEVLATADTHLETARHEFNHDLVIQGLARSDEEEYDEECYDADVELQDSVSGHSCVDVSGSAASTVSVRASTDIRVDTTVSDRSRREVASHRSSGSHHRTRASVDASQHSNSPFVEILSQIAVHQRFPTL